MLDVSSEVNEPAHPKKDGSSNEPRHPPPDRKGSRHLGTLLRALAGLVIVVLVVRNVPMRALAERFLHFSVADVALLLVFTVLQVIANTLRWWRLLVRLGDRPPFMAIMGDLLVGALFNTFLPTSFGGDVIRALRAGRRLDRGYRAWSSSLFERLIGMLVLAIVGAIGALLLTGNALPDRDRYIVVGAALVVALILFFASAPLRLLVDILERRLPTRFIEDVRGVVTDLEGPLATAPARLETLGWSVLAYLLNLAYVIVSVRALGISEHTVAVIAGLPIIAILSLAPVSLGGHGLREGLFVVILGLLGVPKDAALGLALLSLAYNIVLALAGGVVALVAPKPGEGASSSRRSRSTYARR